jgi:hypothetical protein
MTRTKTAIIKVVMATAGVTVLTMVTIGTTTEITVIMAIAAAAITARITEAMEVDV